MLRPHPAAIVLSLFAVGMAGSCRRGEDLPPPAAPVVTVSLPLVKQTTDFEQFTGRTESAERVEIRARVSGYLEKIHFSPGREVKRGELLFEIDARPYEAALKRARGEVAALEARIKRLAADVARANRLLPSNAITREEFEKTVADQAEAEGTLESAKAAVERAELDVEFTRVTAPIDGRIGVNLIDTGNLVAADTTALAEIVALDTIYATFDMDEQTLLRLKAMLRSGKLKARTETEVEVSMAIGEGQDFDHRGTIDFIDSEVDPTTGTLRLRAAFANPPNDVDMRDLMPGLFARVRLQTSEPYPALMVPEAALGSDQGQKYLLVVDNSNTVRYRAVSLGAAEGALRIVHEGLKADDRVVVNGLQRARPGSTVAPQSASAPAESVTKPAR